MKMAQPQLLVGLGEKMSRVTGHWAVVDRQLPPEFPLVLLHGVGRAGFDGLAGALQGLREGVMGAEVGLKLARGVYEVRKRELHGWVRPLNHWVRRLLAGTRYAFAVRRVPGLGQSYEHWGTAGTQAVAMWREMERNPPEVNWPMDLRPDWSLENLEAAGRAFDAAYWAIIAAEVDLKIARGNLRRAQTEATALLMAFGHGVRARLGDHGALVESIPQLWPRHSSRPKEESAVAA